MRSYIFKKKLKNILEQFLKFFLRCFFRLFRLVFAKRTVLFVTSSGIRSVKLGLISQFLILLCLFMVSDLFIQSLRYDEIIDSKSEEIKKLRSANSYFRDEFELINEKLSKVNQYLSTISGSIYNANEEVESEDEEGIDHPKRNKFSKGDKQTLNQIRQSNKEFKVISSVVSKRIDKIEKALSITGLNMKKDIALRSSYIFNKKNNSDMRHQGGPEEDSFSKIDDRLLSKISFDKDYESSFNDKIKFDSSIERLIILEKLAKAMPLSKPMKNYYISSGFGIRRDPITKQNHPHHGVDFVGITNEKIISPSNGKVVLAEWFSDYGNAIVIDHGYGITTRYGHLSKIKVKDGQLIRKGDIIAIQGNTGRSTGPHLHYEVRYKNIPLNPRKFLEAGDFLFNNSNKITRHASS